MSLSPASPGRRRWLDTCLRLAPLGLPGWGLPDASAAQPVPAASTSAKSSWRLVQCLDSSPSQQELSRDYATGLRIAWATELGTAGVGSRLALQTVNIDSGRPAELRAIVRGLLQDPDVLGLVGSCGDALSVQLQAELRGSGARLAHLAPWMADNRYSEDGNLVCLFASRAVQLQGALSAMRGMGADELCVLYSTPAELALYDGQLSTIAQALALRVQRVTGDAGQAIGALAARLPTSSAMLLCLGTSAEMAQLTQFMAARGDHRFVVGLGDVDAPTLLQLAPGRGVPVIMTQVVPNPDRSSLPLVSAYREHLKRLFDEAPSPISLAGYIAGLYAAEMLRDAGPALSRDSLLSQAAKRTTRSLGGWRVEFRDDRRGSRYVTQTMLGRDGRLIG